MKFSIIVTTYNQPQYLAEAVESCFAQTYQDPFEIIIIDDFSNSCATVNISDRSNIDLLYVKNDKNLGLAKSHNIGVYYSSGEWCIRLDHDDKLLPDALQKLSDFIDTEVNKKIGFLYSDLMIMGTNQVRKYPEWKSGSILDLQNIGHLQCYRRDKTLEIGGWDTTLAYSSDTDFIIRLIEHSVQLKHIPEVLVENRLHSEQYTQKFVQEGNNPQFWKNLIFNRALQRRPDLWVEGRQQTIMQTSGSQLWRSEVEAIQKWTDKGLNFIDIGCSNKKKLPHAIGIDLDRNGGKCPEFVYNDKEGLPFKEGSLDGVIASHCLEHIENPIETLDEWIKLIKIGGRIILVIPDVNFTPKMNTEGCDPTHKHDWVIESFRKEVLDNLDKTVFKILHHAQIGNRWSFLTIIEKI